MKKPINFALVYVLIVVFSILLAFCSPAKAGQSEKQTYCTGLAKVAYDAANAIEQGASIKTITDAVEQSLAQSRFTNDTKAAIRGAVSYAIMMASQHNISAETIAKYQYYGCLMST